MSEKLFESIAIWILGHVCVGVKWTQTQFGQGCSWEKMISAIFKRSTSFVRGKQAEELYDRVQLWIRQFNPEQLPKRTDYQGRSCS